MKKSFSASRRARLKRALQSGPGEPGYECSECRGEVRSSDEFCPRCGTLLLDGVRCHNHRNSTAEGACVMCCLPYCKECGKHVRKHFLCNDHRDYEIYQGMARIHGTLDDIAAQHVKSCLEQAGFHPYLFCRSQPRGGTRFLYSLFKTAGEVDGNLMNEIKIMLPLQEVVPAERLLEKLNIMIPAKTTG